MTRDELLHELARRMDAPDLTDTERRASIRHLDRALDHALWIFDQSLHETAPREPGKDEL